MLKDKIIGMRQIGCTIFEAKSGLRRKCNSMALKMRVGYMQNMVRFWEHVCAAANGSVQNIEEV